MEEAPDGTITVVCREINVKAREWPRCFDGFDYLSTNKVRANTDQGPIL